MKRGDIIFLAAITALSILCLYVFLSSESLESDFPTQEEINDLSEQCDNKYGAGNWTFWACQHGCSEGVHNETQEEYRERIFNQFAKDKPII